MKRFAICFILLALSMGTVAQPLTPTNEELAGTYRLRAYRKRTVGIVMCAAGTALCLAGGMLTYRGEIGEPPSGRDPDLVNQGQTMATVGIICAAGSVPLFFLAGKDRKHARDLAVGVKAEVGMVGAKGLAMHRFPALTLRWGLK